MDANRAVAVNGYTISSERTRLDIGLVHQYLSEQAYWARGRTLEVVRRSIDGSLCFGVYKVDEQVGFARVVTDGATFAWLCDVFILDDHRGRGLGKRLLEHVVGEPALQGLAIFVLATRDAHEFYRRYGEFQLLDVPERWMIKRARDS
jgi:GNAT superfamily N-acetyltransferase